MALFARRSLQHLLDELEGALSIEARLKLAHELNRKDASALGFEWELALLYALSRVGKVEYEASANGTSKPDIAFASKAEPSIRFVGDVTTISDAGLHEQNPVERLSLGLLRLKSKYGLAGSLDLRVPGITDGPHYRNQKTRLKLPKAIALDRFLEDRLRPEFQRIAKEKIPAAKMVVKEQEIEFTVIYDESRRFGSSGYPSYTAAQSLTKNPVHTALKAKTDQLKKSGAKGPLGIFLCDGGCSLLSKTSRHVTQFNVEDVIGDFFRQNSSIAFVAVLTFPPTRANPFVGIVKDLKITCRVHPNARAATPIASKALEELLSKGLAALPPPVATPNDALYWIERLGKHEGQTIGDIFQGGGVMSQSVTMSARKFQQLLAGRVTAQELFAEYGRPGEVIDNPFDRALNRGLTVDFVGLRKVPHCDDDLVEIRFSGPDPAISKLKVESPSGADQT